MERRSGGSATAARPPPPVPPGDGSPASRGRGLASTLAVPLASLRAAIVQRSATSPLGQAAARMRRCRGRGRGDGLRRGIGSSGPASRPPRRSVAGTSRSGGSRPVSLAVAVASPSGGGTSFRGSHSLRRGLPVGGINLGGRLGGPGDTSPSGRLAGQAASARVVYIHVATSPTARSATSTASVTIRCRTG